MYEIVNTTSLRKRFAFHDNIGLEFLLENLLNKVPRYYFDPYAKLINLQSDIRNKFEKQKEKIYGFLYYDKNLEEAFNYSSEFVIKNFDNSKLITLSLTDSDSIYYRIYLENGDDIRYEIFYNDQMNIAYSIYENKKVKYSNYGNFDKMNQQIILLKENLN
ncbi:MAG: hypothetical protein JSS63_01300 [Bacteroidetes bacterium]|nr:hypothetical protein [Bacteroidota bacterium]